MIDIADTGATKRSANCDHLWLGCVCVYRGFLARIGRLNCAADFQLVGGNCFQINTIDNNKTRLAHLIAHPANLQISLLLLFLSSVSLSLCLICLSARLSIASNWSRASLFIYIQEEAKSHDSARGIRPHHITYRIVSYDTSEQSVNRIRPVSDE